MMAGSGTGDDASEVATETKRVADTETVAEYVGGVKEQPDRPARRLPTSKVSRGEREQMVKEARSIKFPVTVRGYERAAVDRYVQQINRLIAELEISSSSEAAVRHALAEVSEETREILQHAHETADEIVLRSRAKASDTVEQAEKEAQELLTGAEHEAAEARELARHQAQELLENARREATELQEQMTRDASEARDAAARDAQQLRSAAKAEADKTLVGARDMADELVQAAETRVRELGDNADSIWRERRRLIEDLRVVGEQLLAIAAAESKRFPHLTEAGRTTTEPLREQPLATAALATQLQDAIQTSPAAGEGLHP